MDSSINVRHTSLNELNINKIMIEIGKYHNLCFHEPFWTNIIHKNIKDCFTAEHPQTTWTNTPDEKIILASEFT